MKTTIIKRLKRFNDRHKRYYPSLMLIGTLLIADSAFAANDNKVAIKAMADQLSDLMDGGLAKLVILGGGCVAMFLSVISGFKPTSFFGGLGLIVFYALFKQYTTSFFG